MVLLNASKAARHAGSLVNKPNCGGTAKKAGTGRNLHFWMPNNPTNKGAPQGPAKVCLIDLVAKTQRTGYRATLGPH